MKPEDIERFRKAVKDDKATFFFVPNNLLKDKITEGKDPILTKLPKYVIETLLICGNNSGILIDTNMVVSYLNNKLDKNNAYLLSMGEVRVAGVGDMVLKPKKIDTGEDKDLLMS